MYTLNDIIDEFHPHIRSKSLPVSFPLSKTDRQILADLMEYVRNSVDETTAVTYGLRPSVGIAAPQVNIQKQLCVISTIDETGQFFEHEFINPKIIKHSRFLSYLPNGEGCLSVNRNIEGIVPRYESITVRNYDYEGNAFELSFTGYCSIVVQHEIDHLHGILFMDHINSAAPLKEPDNSAPLIFPET